MLSKKVFFSRLRNAVDVIALKAALVSLVSAQRVSEHAIERAFGGLGDEQASVGPRVRFGKGDKVMKRGEGSVKAGTGKNGVLLCSKLQGWGF